MRIAADGSGVSPRWGQSRDHVVAVTALGAERDFTPAERDTWRPLTGDKLTLRSVKALACSGGSSACQGKASLGPVKASSRPGKA